MATDKFENTNMTTNNSIVPVVMTANDAAKLQQALTGWRDSALHLELRLPKQRSTGYVTNLDQVRGQIEKLGEHLKPGDTMECSLASNKISMFFEHQGSVIRCTKLYAGYVPGLT